LAFDSSNDLTIFVLLEQNYRIWLFTTDEKIIILVPPLMFPLSLSSGNLDKSVNNVNTSEYAYLPAIVSCIAADTKAVELRLYQLIMLHLRFHGSTLAFRLILFPTTVLGLQPCAFRSDRNGCLT